MKGWCVGASPKHPCAEHTWGLNPAPVPLHCSQRAQERLNTSDGKRSSSPLGFVQGRKPTFHPKSQKNPN